ncbi:MAG TPA: phosphoribosylglycinamide formyltransferase [bacterium]
MTDTHALMARRDVIGLRIGVLVSGNGTNLQAILDACARGDIAGGVVLVVSSSAKAFALERARRAGVPTVVLTPKEFSDRASYDARLIELLRTAQVELVCLAGFLRILTPQFVEQFAGRIMNIHPALLPAFGGPGMYGAHVHEAVLASGVKVSGCTVHFADETPDGGPIILQSPVRVEDDDTVESLAARVGVEEHRLYPAAIRMFAEERLQVIGRRVYVVDPAGPRAPAPAGRALLREGDNFESAGLTQAKKV